jgi:hypothetical protein
MDRKTKLNRDKAAIDDDEAFTAQLLRDKAVSGDATRTRLIRDKSTKDNASRTKLIRDEPTKNDDQRTKLLRDKSTKDDASRTKLAREKTVIEDDEEFTRQLLRDKAANADVSRTKLVRDKLPTKLTSSSRDEVHHSPLEFQKASTPGTQMPKHDTNMTSRQTRMESLRPQERQEQENWQKTRLQQGSSVKSHLPSETTFNSDYDKKMASRQTRFESLAPKEREEQEAWAQTQLSQLSTACPEGWDWGRIPGGYQCRPGGYLGNHKVTDDLLAEGKGGVWYRLTQLSQRWHGPFYEAPDMMQREQMVRDEFGDLQAYFRALQGWPPGRMQYLY